MTHPLCGRGSAEPRVLLAVKVTPASGTGFFHFLFSNKKTFHASSISDPYMLPPVNLVS